MAGRFERKKTSNGQYMFNLRAGNGEIVLTSQRYASRSGELNGIRSVKANARADKNYERRRARNGKHCFVLLAKNRRVIAHSQLYTTTRSMENGIKACKRDAPGAKLD
ncbi:MAG: YegP family protein [Myxococcota bacterium]